MMVPKEDVKQLAESGDRKALEEFLVQQTERLRSGAITIQTAEEEFDSGLLVYQALQRIYEQEQEVLARIRKRAMVLRSDDL